MQDNDKPTTNYSEKIKRVSYLAIYIILSCCFFFRQNFKMTEDEAKKFEYVYISVISVLMFISNMSKQIEKQINQFQLAEDDKKILLEINEKVDAMSVINSSRIPQGESYPPYPSEDGIFINAKDIQQRGKINYGDYVIEIVDTSRNKK